MANIEVDEADLQNLRAQVGHLGAYKKVFDALKTNPDAERLFHAAIKTVSPKTAIPSFDQHAMVHAVLKKVEEQLGATTKKFDEHIEKQTKERVENDLNSRVSQGREYLRSRGYQKDAIEKVEKIMQERGIADYEAADSLFMRLNPPNEMAMPGAQSPIDFLNDPQEDAEAERKLLFSGAKGREGDKFVKLQVPKILAEIRGQHRAA